MDWRIAHGAAKLAARVAIPLPHRHLHCGLRALAQLGIVFCMIDKIGYTRPTTSTARTGATKRTSATSGSQFIDALSKAEGVSAASDVDAVGSVAALTGVGGLIGIQEVSEDEVKRKRAYKQGRLTLDALEQLRDGLLSGSLPVATLRNLERMVAQERTLVSDPKLNAILDDIELRAAVELAKLEMSGMRG